MPEEISQYNQVYAAEIYDVINVMLSQDVYSIDVLPGESFRVERLI
jgi:hypothetical protein